MWECVFEVELEGVRLPITTLMLSDAGLFATLSVAPVSADKDQTYRLTCRLPCTDGAEATNRAEAALQRLFDRLAVLQRARFHGFHHACTSEVTLDGITINAAPVYHTISAHIVKDLSEGEVLHSCTARWSPLAQTFRQAAASDDVVARFILLYHVLLLTCGDAQDRVDAYLLSKAPTLPTTPSPINGRPETVLTRLRNEIAHKRANTSLEGTRKEMKRWVQDLEGFACAAVLERG